MHKLQGFEDCIPSTTHGFKHLIPSISKIKID
jgi:hypothetical protein